MSEKLGSGCIKISYVASTFFLALGLFVQTSAPAYALPAPLQAHIHCYTEEKDLAPVTLPFVPYIENPSFIDAYGTIGRIGDLEVQTYVGLRKQDGALQIISSNVYLVNRDSSRIGGGGIQAASENEGLPLPASKRFSVVGSHELLRPFDFGEGNITCDVTIR